MIISSNCVAGRLYNIRNEEYKSPFVWNSIYLSDFVKLIENWNSINFDNIVCFFTDNKFGREKCTTVKLDNSILIYFTHHLQNDSVACDYKNGGDYISGNILDYVSKKWHNRTKIMCENPCFIYDDISTYTDTDVMNFINVNTPYKRLLITKENVFKNYETDRLKVYVKKEDNYHTLKLANELYNDKSIKDFLYE